MGVVAAVKDDIWSGGLLLLLGCSCCCCVSGCSTVTFDPLLVVGAGFASAASVTLLGTVVVVVVVLRGRLRGFSSSTAAVSSGPRARLLDGGCLDFRTGFPRLVVVVVVVVVEEEDAGGSVDGTAAAPFGRRVVGSLRLVAVVAVGDGGRGANRPSWSRCRNS